MTLLNRLKLWLQPRTIITHMTLAEAEELLLAAVPKDRSVQIKVIVWHYDHMDRAERVTSFEVWDERELYTGTTLAEAVNLCVAAQSAHEFASLAQIESVVSEAHQPPALEPMPTVIADDDIPF